MKKKMAITLAMLIALGSLAACSEKKELQDSSTTNIDENIVSEDMGNSSQTTASKTFIGEEKTKEIIAEKEGVAVATIDFKKIELDEEDGIWVYDVEFFRDNTEFDVEINAENGEIIKWEKEIKK